MPTPHHDAVEILLEKAMELGRADIAGDLLRSQALAETPKASLEDAERLYARAVDALNANRYAEALEILTRAVRLKPEIGAWHEALGVAYAQLRRYAEAVATFRVAVKLDPQSYRAWNNLALGYVDLRQLPEAEIAYREAVKLGPVPLEVSLGLVRTLSEQKKFTEAEVEVRKLTVLHPNEVAVWSAYGIVLFRLKRHDESIEILRNAIAMKPDAEMYANLAAALGQTKQWEECEKVSREAVRLNPNYAIGWGNLGNCLREQGRFAEAEPVLRETVRLNPRDFEAASNLALTLATLGRAEEAQSWYEHAIKLSPENGRVRFNSALNLLLLGNFERGWAEYEYRFETDQMTGAKRTYPVAEWTGGPLKGRTILVHCEQGAGDVIQFIRYARELTNRGATVLVQPPKHLASIIRTVPGIARVVDEEKIQVTIHGHSSVMSLPFRLKIDATNPASVGNHVPYITAPQEMQEKWRKRLAGIPGFKVGIAWQGNPKHIGDRWRSVPLSLFEPLSKVNGVSLCSIQKGPGIEQLAESRFPIIDLGAEIEGDFGDTAGLISQLDLVIAIDTSVIHIAGAIGRPVWAAIAFNNDWRWLRNREDTLWYPTMKLFRQSKLGDWQSVFARIGDELSQYAADRLK